MFHTKKFIRKTTKFERWQKRAPEMAKIWQESDLESRPEKYLDCALMLLRSPEPMKKEIKEIFYFLKPHFSSLRGASHPMPHLAGIVYMAYKKTIWPLKREKVANIFGTNIDMVTKGYKEIRSFYLSHYASQNNVKITCPKCLSNMVLSNSFWGCSNCNNSAYAYNLRKNFFNLNKDTFETPLNKFRLIDVPLILS